MKVRYLSDYGMILGCLKGTRIAMDVSDGGDGDVRGRTTVATESGSETIRC